MAFTLKTDQSIRRRLKSLLRRQLQRGEQSLRKARVSSVHEARRNVKKARSVVALLQQADTASLGEDARRLRAAAHALAALSDADSVVAAFDRLRSRYPRRLPEHTYAMLRRRLVRDKTRASTGATFGRKLGRAARTLHAVRRSAKRWQVPSLRPRALARLVKPGYRASRQAMRSAQDKPVPTALHRWRRRTKTLWYHLRLVQAFAPALRDQIRGLERLETWLGEDHDLTVLQAALAKDRDAARRVPAAVREMTAMSEAEQAKLRKKAFALGSRLLRQRPKAFARRVRHAASAQT